MSEPSLSCDHKCCLNASSRIFYNHKTFRWAFMVENLRAITIRFCPFCGEELL